MYLALALLSLQKSPWYDKFEQMKDEYYSLRGWDVKTGLQTRAKLEELQMGDIARELEKKKLLG